jgi:flagellar motor switch protein FliN/FliY
MSANEDLRWVSDVPCKVEFVLGTASITVGACLELARQSIVRLDQSAGSDMELRGEGIPLAVGEVAVIEDQAGLRITRVLPPAGSDPA